MDTEEQLRQAIADEPEEDTPRLAFADWLDEQGGEVNTARAEFIRLQVALFRLPDETPETKPARRRAAELLERYRQVWGFPDGPLRTRCVIRRGFVDELHSGDTYSPPIMSPCTMLTMLAHYPITRVRLGRLHGGMAEAFETFEALDVPAFRKVRSLAVVGEEWTDELLGRLLALWHLPELDSLSFMTTDATPAAVRAVAACPRLGRLRVLRIGFVGEYWLAPQSHVVRGVRDDGAAVLAASPVLANLRELSLRGAGIGPWGAQALARSETLANLERLILTANPDIDADGRDALIQRFGKRVVL